MDKLAKLAALQQLRASGALSDEEFQAQKDSLLESKKTWWLGALAVLVAGALIAGFLLFRKPTDDAKVVSKSPAIANSPTAAGEVADEITPDSKLGDFIKVGNLGARLVFWESIAGPAKETNGQNRTYTVAGCDVDVELNDDKTVFAFGFKPSKRCDVDLDQFFSTAVGTASSLTISRLRDRGASFRSDCISMCGNAAGDPVVQAVSGGSESDKYRTLIADIVLDDDVSIAASTKWEAAMKRAGRTDEYIQSVGFNCDTSFDKDAMNAFGSLPAEHIKITNGYPNLDSDGCGSGD